MFSKWLSSRVGNLDQDATFSFGQSKAGPNDAALIFLDEAVSKFFSGVEL